MSEMIEPDANGWFEVGDDFEAVPNDCFDVIAKYYDAGLDQFMIVRLPGCVINDGRILWGEPFPGKPAYVDIMDLNYRPTHWRPLPLPPVVALSQANSTTINSQEQKP